MRPLLHSLSVGLLLATACPLAAQTNDAATKGARGAYSIALRCFSAHGMNSGAYKKAGDATNAVATEKRARASYEAVIMLGRKLAYNDGKIDQDIAMSQAQEVPRLLKDKAYFSETLGTCRQVGL